MVIVYLNILKLLMTNKLYYFYVTFYLLMIELTILFYFTLLLFNFANQISLFLAASAFFCFLVRRFSSPWVKNFSLKVLAVNIVQLHSSESWNKNKINICLTCCINYIDFT